MRLTKKLIDALRYRPGKAKAACEHARRLFALLQLQEV
jgi:hypothetical protein